VLASRDTANTWFARAFKSSVPEPKWAEKEVAMLVLSRKVGERLVVPDLGVTLTVLSVERGRVRLGIVAPAQMPVHRDEVWRRLRQAQDGPAAPLPCRP
jgi:carbon storage regulator